MTMFNQWKISGEVFYLKELQGEFAASLKVRGEASRFGTPSQIMEFSCLMLKDAYEDAKRKGLRVYHSADLSGHVESWYVGHGDRPRKLKVYFIADKVDNVGGF